MCIDLMSNKTINNEKSNSLTEIKLNERKRDDDDDNSGIDVTYNSM